MTTRRAVLLALSALPVLSLAQSGKVLRVGFLTPRRVVTMNTDDVYRGLPIGLRELGYVEGKNLVIEVRAADGNVEWLPALAAELVNAKVNVIVTAGSQATAAAQKATATIPIVMGTVADPVEIGFVKSLAHPGGNITGLSNLGGAISSKNFELLRDFVPKMSRVAVLVNSSNKSKPEVLAGVGSAARKANVKMITYDAQTPSQIDQAFAAMARDKVDALIVGLDSFFFGQRRQFAELTLKYKLPSMFTMHEHAESGALMSYGQKLEDNFRRAATYVDKIFKGAKPGDLPIEQSTTLELYINRKTARALGLTIPQSLLISADKVIE